MTTFPPTDEQLWWSVRETVRSVLLPQLADPWARVAAIQLVGLADFARTRGDDPWPARLAELAGALGIEGDADPGDILHRASTGPRRRHARARRRAGPSSCASSTTTWRSTA